MATSHQIWFERPILPHLAADVADRCTILGPGTDAEPFVGIDHAAGVVASLQSYDGPLFDSYPHVQVVARTGIGYDTVDVSAATERGVAVCNVPDGPTTATAEHAVALMLAAAKQLKTGEARLRAAAGNFYASHSAIQLDGKQLGLVGFGRIARRVAAMASGIGMKVSAYDPFVDPRSIDPSVSAAESVEALLASSDIISVHVPLSAETQGLFDDALLAHCKPGSVFVNTARGGLVDLAALARALDSGRLVAAGLDVTDPEPLPADHPLLGREDVIVTPHIASATPEAKTANFLGALDQVIDVLEGRQPPHLVNPDVWPNRRLQ